MNIKKIRQAQGLTQMELAQKAFLTVTTISRVENGLPIGKNTLKRIADALGVRPSDITGVKITPLRSQNTRKKS